MKTPVMVKSILLRDFNVEMRLFGGHDWQPSTTTTAAASDGPSSAAPTADDKTEKAQKLLDALLENYVDESEKLMQNKPKSRPTKHRKTEEMLELRLSNIKLRLDLYAEDSPQPLAQNTVLHVGDVEILDYISTSQIRKLLCYWKSDTFHPRETGTPLFHFHLMTVRTTEEEHRLKLKFLPLRINLDQDVLDFLKHFSSSADSPDDDEEKGARNVKPDLPAPLHAPTVVSDKPETAPGVASFFFQSVDIRSFKIKIDYRPQRVDFQALQAGDYLEVINLFVLEGMELSLRHIKLSGVSNWDALINQTLVHWVQDISRHQIHKCLASVVPMRSLSNIGAGAADLILLPMAQYGKDRRVVRGLRKGATSFLKSVTIETLNTASKLARGTKSLLESADHVMQDSKKKKTLFNSRKGNTHARYLISQPANATEGWNQAYASMSRELHVVAKTIVAVPLLEYQRTGSHGYVKSVIRAVPVAVLRPMIGATEAMSRALIGVRNAVPVTVAEQLTNQRMAKADSAMAKEALDAVKAMVPDPKLAEKMLKRRLYNREQQRRHRSNKAEEIVRLRGEVAELETEKAGLAGSGGDDETDTMLPWKEVSCGILECIEDTSQSNRDMKVLSRHNHDRIQRITEVTVDRISDDISTLRVLFLSSHYFNQYGSVLFNDECHYHWGLDLSHIEGEAAKLAAFHRHIARAGNEFVGALVPLLHFV
ncbi:hypothetical protein DYB36_010515 [Aphanomyces astaci]|uniref:Autophagy-related protein 2 n=2 Tax=Aphanomyces astaci TaxID=112090 RepID=A0A397AVR3_APHAT|nr:hypothetical protein DYB36_010515 [Aphanomyces astaci]